MRSLIVIAASYATGALLSLLLAWAIAVTVVPFEKDRRLWPKELRPIPHDHQLWWTSHAPESAPQQPMVTFETSALGVEHLSMWEPRFDHELGESSTYGVKRIRSGWPMLCAEGAYWWAPPDHSRIHFSNSVPLMGAILPFKPIWWGFLLNTLLYGSLAYTPTLLLRRRWRACSAS